MNMMTSILLQDEIFTGYIICDLIYNEEKNVGTLMKHLVHMYIQI